LAFAGYGITNQDAHYDDYAGFDAKGKVVLLLRYEPHDKNPKSEFGGEQPSPFAAFQAKARTAKEHGAAGLLIVNPPLHHGDKDKLFPFDSVEATQSYGLPMMQITRALAGQVLKAAGAPDLETLQNELDSGRKPRPFDLKPVRAKGVPGVERQKGKTRNVIGLLRGSGALADQYVAIGAHYDHLGIAVPRGTHTASQSEGARPEIHNGADDNASGDAGLILLANIFARASLAAGDGGRLNAPNTGKAARTRQLAEKSSGEERSLLFIAFSGEEMGLLGSM